MKKTILLFLTALCLSAFSFAQANNQQGKIHIIPEPVSVNLQKGNFLLKPNTSVVVSYQMKY